MNRKKSLKIALPVAAALIVALALAWRFGSAREGGGAPSYETRPASRGRVAATVTASGTLSALVTVEVGSQVSGRVLALNADFNSQVKKGQVVARIDPSIFESQVAQARANEQVALASVRGAEANRAEAKRQHDRTRALAEKSLVAKADAETTLAKLEAADADLLSAKAKVAQARAARIQADTNLAYTTITSPIDGVVISRDVNEGQTVASSLQAPKLFTIAEDLRKMEVHTDVAESDVGRLQAGFPVEFSVDAFPGERFRGTVKEVRYAPKTVQNVVTYDAVISVDNSELKLRPGMTADVSFIIEDLADVLRVPNTALRFRPPGAAQDAAAAAARPGARRGEAAANGANPRAGAGAGGGAAEAAANGARPRAGGAGAAAGGGAEAGARAGGQRRVVYVLAPDGALRAVPVKIGPSDGSNTAVLGGELSEGDQVVIGVAGAAAPAGGGGAPARAQRPGRYL